MGLDPATVFRYPRCRSSQTLAVLASYCSSSKHPILDMPHNTTQTSRFTLSSSSPSYNWRIPFVKSDVYPALYRGDFCKVKTRITARPSRRSRLTARAPAIHCPRERCVLFHFAIYTDTRTYPRALFLLFASLSLSSLSLSLSLSAAFIFAALCFTPFSLMELRSACGQCIGVEKAHQPAEWCDGKENLPCNDHLLQQCSPKC